jgi:acetyl esterase
VGTVENEGVLDPWVSTWLAENHMQATPLEELDPAILELARGPFGLPPAREIVIAQVSDETVDTVPIRIYQGDGEPTGLIVYFHGGGFVMGSIGIMDNVARELAHGSGAVVISVEYRLAPEHPYPAGLEDCKAVTRWALANAARFNVPPHRVAVAGESAGGNLAAAVALRLRDAGESSLAGQVLMYPAVAGPMEHPSTVEFDGLIISRKAGEAFWAAYSGEGNIDDDPYAAPLRAGSLTGLPPALVVLGGCDMLRDEGRSTPGGSGTTAWTSTRCATPVNLTALSISSSPPRPRPSNTSAAGSGRSSARQHRRPEARRPCGGEAAPPSHD